MASVAISLAVSAGLGLLAALLLKPKNNNAVQDEGPPQLAQRGVFLTYLIGKRVLGSVICFVGNRSTGKDSGKGKGTGGFGGKQTIYFEEGWHVLAYPAKPRALVEIQQSGKTIFEGPITPESHPSGSTVNIGKEGSFIIYWGEDDQPHNEDIAAASGVRSRWPGLASIYWKPKRLGLAKSWPPLRYIFDNDLQYSLLTRSKGYREPTRSPGPRDAQIERLFSTTNKIRTAGNNLDDFRPGRYAEVTGNAAIPDQKLRVIKSEIFNEYSPFGQVTVFTDVFVDAVLPDQSPGDGNLRAFVDDPNDGYNPAHMIAQILFAPHPAGLGLDQSDFNIDQHQNSLEDLGVLLEAEGLVGSVISRESGNDVEEILTGILQDCGVMLTLNGQTELYDFVPIREAGQVPFFGDDFFLAPEPVIETSHLERAANRSVFTFEDRENNYRTQPVGSFDDDGEFSRQGYYRAQSYPMVIPTDFDSASLAAERRSQEALADGVAVKLPMVGAARLLEPGRQFETSKTPGRLICTGKTIDPLTSAVTIEAAESFMAAELTAPGGRRKGGGGGEVKQPEVPAAYRLVEVPGYLSNGQQLVGVLLIRAHDQIESHTIHVSSDDSSYRVIATSTLTQTGGALQSEISADTDDVLEAGLFEISELGPDIASLVLDLSGDDNAWRKGRQLLAINDEIMFLDGLTSVGGEFALGRLIRARYDTNKQTHAAGSIAYILDSTSFVALNEPEVIPNATIYVKPQPNASESLPLSAVPATSIDLGGKGIFPQPANNLSASSASLGSWSDSFLAGEDVLVGWGYAAESPIGTGMGLQDAGNAHGSATVPDFLLEILVTGSSNVLASFNQNSLQRTLTNAELVSLFGSEPASFDLQVTTLGNGYNSASIKITVTKITP